MNCINKEKIPKLFRPADLLLVIITVVLSIALLVHFSDFNKKNTVVVITVNGLEYERVSLPADEKKEIAIAAAYPLVVVIEGGRVSIQEAHCPDQVCVQAGWIERAGSSIICLPAHVAVHIEAASMADGITY